MKYPTADRFRTALEDRLRRQAREGGLPLTRLRKDVVFDRLLARLLIAAPERWILKGGLALDYRLGDRARTTKDMDLGRQDDTATATADLMAAAALDLGDYFRYVIEQSDVLSGLHDGTAVRYRVHAELAGRTFEHVTVDIGFDAPTVYAVEFVRGRGLLDFADLESPLVPAIPLTYHVAEKVHAYTRSYSAGGRESTRVKDLVDLVLIATDRATTLTAGALRGALDDTFTRRATHRLPRAIPRPPQAWTVPYRKIATEVSLDTAIAAGHTCAVVFLDPVLTGTCAPWAVWQAEAMTWSADDLPAD